MGMGVAGHCDAHERRTTEEPLLPRRSPKEGGTAGMILCRTIKRALCFVNQALLCHAHVCSMHPVPLQVFRHIDKVLEQVQEEPMDPRASAPRRKRPHAVVNETEG